VILFLNSSFSAFSNFFLTDDNLVIYFYSCFKNAQNGSGDWPYKKALEKITKCYTSRKSIFSLFFVIYLVLLILKTIFNILIYVFICNYT